MTTGLEDGVPDNHCTIDSCLVYKADAGTRWAYHNAPYTLLDPVLQQATGKSLNLYCKQKIRDKIGMNGGWATVDYDNVFFSNARSMVRYGLLLLNKGKWAETPILTDSSYFYDMTHSSQSLNNSYGYLTWLNGQVSYMLPTVQNIFSGMMVPAAPADMFAALGKNDQKIYVVPSEKIVVIRMGDSAGNSMQALSSFDNELWTKINAVIGR
jgi:CubicO group peptidase (beta-lactamase class C family)